MSGGASVVEDANVVHKEESSDVSVSVTIFNARQGFQSEVDKGAREIFVPKCRGLLQPIKSLLEKKTDVCPAKRHFAESWLVDLQRLSEQLHRIGRSHRIFVGDS